MKKLAGKLTPRILSLLAGVTASLSFTSVAHGQRSWTEELSAVHSPPSPWPCHGLLSACLQLKENPKPEAGFVSNYLTCMIFLSRQTHCLTWAVRRSNAIVARRSFCPIPNATNYCIPSSGCEYAILSSGEKLFWFVSPLKLWGLPVSSTAKSDESCAGQSGWPCSFRAQ